MRPGRHAIRAKTPSVAPTTTASPSGYAKSTASASAEALECSATGCKKNATHGVTTISITTTPSIQRWSSKGGTRSRTNRASAATISGYQASQKTSERLVSGVSVAPPKRRLQMVSPRRPAREREAHEHPRRPTASGLQRTREASTGGGPQQGVVEPETEEVVGSGTAEPERLMSGVGGNQDRERQPHGSDARSPDEPGPPARHVHRRLDRRRRQLATTARLCASATCCRT
jgi:hypothetical protein